MNLLVPVPFVGLSDWVAFGMAYPETRVILSQQDDQAFEALCLSGSFLRWLLVAIESLYLF